MRALQTSFAALTAAALLFAPASARAAEPESTARRTAPRRSVLYSFVPFGVGQFANEQPVKGSLFLVSETLAFGTAAAAFAAFESNKIEGGLFEGGRFRDPELASTLQTTYLAAFWAGAALVVGGVVDALVSRPDPQDPVAVTFGPGSVVVRF